MPGTKIAKADKAVCVIAVGMRDKDGAYVARRKAPVDQKRRWIDAGVDKITLVRHFQ